MKSQYAIALMIETSSMYGRQILRGIQRYIQTEGKRNWIAVIEERDVVAGVPDWIKNWSGDGIISRRTSDAFESEVVKRDIAFIQLNDRLPSNNFTKIRSDDVEIGRVAAAHFRERGLQNFAFCGFSNEAWSERRQRGFQAEVETIETHTLNVFESNWFAEETKRWDVEQSKLTQWLVSLPKPIGVLACNDVRGKQLIDCCQQSGIDVPESVAVVGVDNDELLCDFCHTPLTSIMPDAEAIGYRSASIMAEMLTSKRVRKLSQEITIAPLGIIARRSSDIVAVDDDELAAALKFIRHNACRGISVGDIVEAVGMSRSTVERKMRDVIGRSPQQEIRRVQLREVCTLLTSTDLPIEHIAMQCGYEHAEYLHVVFKRELKITPGQFRNSSRKQGSQSR